jgi:two-component system response regulator YesN
VISDDATPLDQTLEGVILLDAVLEVFRSLYNTKKTTHKRQLNKQQQKWLIEEYISNFFHFSDGLSGLASQLYLSERQTRRIVKQFFGEEYKTLIIKQRMETAQILLKTSNLSLDQIAEKVGYKSYSGFHMAFVKAFGVTPGDYRKNI